MFQVKAFINQSITLILPLEKITLLLLGLWADEEAPAVVRVLLVHLPAHPGYKSIDEALNGGSPNLFILY